MRTLNLPAGVVRGVVRYGLRPVLGKPVPPAVQRFWMELLVTGAPLPPGTTVERVRIGGRPGERVSAPGADSGRAILLLHGGAFMTCSARTHRPFAAHLAAAAGAPVWVPDYRRAPENPYPAAVDDAIAAYDQLSAAVPTAVVGDSAGATLALLLARSRAPVAIALASPLVELTLELSSAYTGPDVMIRDGWAQQGCQGFVGAADARELSPVHGDLSGLPPLLVHVCEQDRLRPEGELLAARVRAGGGDVDLVVLPGAWHDIHTFAHLVAEGADACADMGRWLAARLASAVHNPR